MIIHDKNDRVIPIAQMPHLLEYTILAVFS